MTKKSVTNISEVYAAGGGTPLARSNVVVTEVSEPRIIPYVRPDCGGCACCRCGLCGALFAALCLCGACGGRRACGGGTPCYGRDWRCACACDCRAEYVAPADVRCGCCRRGYTTYYPYYS